jgi:hypothetical protein
MSAASDILKELDAIGATIASSGDRLVLRAGAKPVPAGIIRRLRDAKPELLALLPRRAPNFARLVPQTASEPGLEQPCAARRGKVLELNGAFLHFCCRCGRFGAFGYGVRLRAGKLGRWYCGEHRPQPRYQLSCLSAGGQ